MKKLLTLIALLLLVGCATPYQEMGYEGGFRSQHLSPDTFTVQFLGNGFTSQKQAAGFALLRASEITQKTGYRYFTILQDMNQTSVDYAQFSTPGYTHGTVNVIGNVAYFNATTTAPMVHNVPIVKPGWELLVRCSNTLPPNERKFDIVNGFQIGPGTIYDANERATTARAKFKVKG
jgi:hypothetical protein